MRLFLTGLLNMSLLAWAAMPPLIFGALDRRAATPLTLKRSEKVAICVSIAPWTSVAIGGAITVSGVRMVGVAWCANVCGP